MTDTPTPPVVREMSDAALLDELDLLVACDDEDQYTQEHFYELRRRFQQLREVVEKYEKAFTTLDGKLIAPGEPMFYPEYPRWVDDEDSLPCIEDGVRGYWASEDPQALTASSGTHYDYDGMAYPNECTSSLEEAKKVCQMRADESNRRDGTQDPAALAARGTEKGGETDGK